MSQEDLKQFEDMMKRDVEKKRQEQQISQMNQQQQPPQPPPQPPQPPQHRPISPPPQEDDEIAYICTIASMDQVLNRAVVVAPNVFDAMVKVVSRFGNQQEDLFSLTIKIDVADVIQ